MNTRKSMVLIVLMVFIGAAVSLWSATGETYGDYEYGRLMEKALQKGGIPVIVKISVPDIDRLTALSASFRTTRDNPGALQSAFDADMDLESAISFSANEIFHQLNGAPYKVNHIFKTVPFMAVSVGPEALERLSRMPGVLHMEAEGITRLPEVVEEPVCPGDVEYPMLQDSTLQVGADFAWGAGYGGQGWYVAILDSGVRKTHEMFTGKNFVEACFARGEVYEDNRGDCPNGGISQTGPGSGLPYMNKFAHGTHVAGIAAGNNKKGKYGVARDAHIMAINVFSYFPDEDDIGAYNGDVAAALEYVYSLRNTYHIASANLSLGGGRYYSYCNNDLRSAVIGNLRSAGIATAISTGNDYYCDSVGSPGCIENAISVGNVNKQDQHHASGNWNNTIMDLLAPGVSIYSSVSNNDTSYAAYTGTSMSSPHVAGAWAIIRQFDSTITVADAENLLKNTGALITSSICANTVQKPRLDIGDALMTLLLIAPPIELEAEQEINKSLLMKEYINVLTWEANPLNQNKVVTKYQIYEVTTGGSVLLSEVTPSTFSYMHRKVESRQNKTYAVTAVDDKGNVSPPITYNLKFGIQ